MKTIKSRSKKGSQLYSSWLHSTRRTLYQCYDKCSTNKELAMIECLNKLQKEEGWDFRIMSFNTFQFTCGWRISGGLRVETRCNSYLIEFDDKIPFDIVILPHRIR